MVTNINAWIEINGKIEFHFIVAVDYKINKDFDDLKVWGAIDINNTWIEEMTEVEAEIILNGKITCFHSDTLEEYDTDLNYLFGGEAEFLKEVKKILQEA